MDFFLTSLWWASVALLCFFGILWIGDKIILWRAIRHERRFKTEFTNWWNRR